MKTSSEPHAVSVAVYRGLLFLYPPGFRQEFGEDIVQVFRDRIRERGPARSWVLVIGDLLVTVPEQLMRGVALNRIIVGFLVLAAALFAVPLFGPERATLLVSGLGVIALSLAFGVYLLSRRVERSSEYRYAGPEVSWPWWTLLALPLGAFYIATGTMGVADEGGDLVEALLFSFAPAALIVGGLVLRSRGRLWANIGIALATLPAISWFWMVVPPIVGLMLLGSALFDLAASGIRSLRSRGLNRA